MKNEIKFIDLFAGIGGFRIGFEKAGFRCVFSSEIEKNCRETYKINFGEYPAGDITKISADSIHNHDILLAGFPCQPFSISGKLQGFEDTRGTLFFDILRIAEAKSPKVIVLENVKHLMYHDKGRTLKVMLKHLNKLGYKVSWKILNASDFGVPQNRERTFIVASKGKSFDFTLLKKRRGKIIKDILDSEGDFEFLKMKDYTIITPQIRQKSGLIFAGYRNKKIRIAGVRPNTNHLSRVHKQPNRIYSSDGVHPTLPSQETAGRFFIMHKGKVRKLTFNEARKLMGFSDDFKWTSSNGERYKQLGNSVCIPLVEELARQIKMQIFEK
jgi:DNA (cytosine-5)-methyltransferase 1